MGYKLLCVISPLRFLHRLNVEAEWQFKVTCAVILRRRQACLSGQASCDPLVGFAAAPVASAPLTQYPVLPVRSSLPFLTAHVGASQSPALVSSSSLRWSSNCFKGGPFAGVGHYRVKISRAMQCDCRFHTRILCSAVGNKAI
jgi:hypothetical protein